MVVATPDRIVKKIFRSLLMMYYSKKIAIEESKNLNTYKLAELIGSITTYEMGGKSVALKVTK